MDDMYPDEDELKTIKEWPYTDFVGLLEYCMGLWQFKDYATKRGRNYRFATGGWSGNESIIEAMGENHIFWMSCWESSHRGGLYKFKVEKRNEKD